MSYIKTISIVSAIVTLTISGLSYAADQFIVEIHPTTFYPVTLEFKETSSGKDIYEPIPSTPEASKNICVIKPEVCVRTPAGTGTQWMNEIF